MTVIYWAISLDAEWLVEVPKGIMAIRLTPAVFRVGVRSTCNLIVEAQAISIKAGSAINIALCILFIMLN